MRLAARILCGLGIAPIVAGCADQQTSALNAANAFNAAHAGAKPSQKDMDARIAKIQNNPNLPPEAKSMEIGQMMAHSGVGGGGKH